MGESKVTDSPDSHIDSILVYSTKPSPRLNYILRFFSDQLGCNFSFTDNRELFENSSAAKINYSHDRKLHGAFWILNHEILFEDEIKEQMLQIGIMDNQPVFFENDRELYLNNGIYPFDIFAASFYLLSRHEEYLPHNKDMYGRYSHENSVAFKNNFLHIPLINIWLNIFRKDLQKKYPALKFKNPEFSFLPTYDIDIAYAYKSKGLLRNAGAVAKSVVHGKNPELSSRLKTLVANMPDPFDVYAELDELHEKYKLNPLYFFLVAGKNSIYDKNILPEKPLLKKLISETAGKYSIGLHPSWQSGDDKSFLKREKNNLEKITGKEINVSRQHYIRFDLPTTFRHLIEAGITDDHSMGYGSINGFRASVASPYNWFDLEKNEETKLRLHPFCYMDANSLYEQKFTPEQAYEEMMKYYSTCKDVGGTFISIWHNHLLGRSKLYRGWKEVYFRFIEAVC